MAAKTKVKAHKRADGTKVKAHKRVVTYKKPRGEGYGPTIYRVKGKHKGLMRRNYFNKKRGKVTRRELW